MSEPAFDKENKEFDYAWRLVKQTNRCVYLTGKAGSGKTTFLRYVAENSSKNMAVLAPTGVAAINARGQTIHSFFKLPFGPLLPTDNRFSVTNRSDEGLFTTLKYRRDKIETIEKLELLIIDEISMVRADILDLIDKILKAYRKSFLPFGGVQVLLIGDPFQLPPVFRPEETKSLETCYDNLYFFGSDVFHAAKPVFIELKKVYRQADERFVELLNRIRVVDIQDNDLELINSRVKSKEELRAAKNNIILTTTNQRVDRYNEQRLNRLEVKEHEYKAKIQGDFPEKNAPTDVLLKLKVGAQVMFVKNDPSTARSFYNGMLATVVSLSKKEIEVESHTGKRIKVAQDTWDNVAYKWNKKEQKMDEEVKGSFIQYPLRLAWAITVHKSQGLTFDSIIADVSSSFSPGQIYVALSRCTSLEGVMLTNPLQYSSFQKNWSVMSFALAETSHVELERVIEESSISYSVDDAFQALENGNIQQFWYIMEEIDPKGKQWNSDSFRIFLSGYFDKLWQNSIRADNLEYQLKEVKNTSQAFATAKESLKEVLSEKKKLEMENKKLQAKLSKLS